MPAGIYGYSLNEKSLVPHNTTSFLLSQYSSKNPERLYILGVKKITIKKSFKLLVSFKNRTERFFV